MTKHFITPQMRSLSELDYEEAVHKRQYNLTRRYGLYSLPEPCFRRPPFAGLRRKARRDHPRRLAVPWQTAIFQPSTMLPHKSSARSYL